MKRILVFTLLLSNIGFSQNCENSILDEVLLNENVNQYFQLALSLNVAELGFLNDCETDGPEYVMFAPGNNVPSSSITPLLSVDGDLINFINYYITGSIYQLWDVVDPNPGPADWFGPFGLNMMDGNETQISIFIDDVFDGLWTINDINIQTDLFNPICACNGSIYIIDDLIWAPGVVSLEEDGNILELYPNPAKNLLNVSKINEKGVLKIMTAHGKTIFSKEVDNSIQINTSTYQPGIYVVNFTSKNQNFSKTVLVN